MDKQTGLTGVWRICHYLRIYRRTSLQLWEREIRSITPPLSLPWPAANHGAFLCPICLQGAISHRRDRCLLGKIDIVKKIRAPWKLLACKNQSIFQGGFGFLQMWHNPGNPLWYPSTTLESCLKLQLSGWRNPPVKPTQQIALELGPLGFQSSKTMELPSGLIPNKGGHETLGFLFPNKVWSHQNTKNFWGPELPSSSQTIMKNQVCAYICMYSLEKWDSEAFKKNKQTPQKTTKTKAKQNLRLILSLGETL